MKIMTNQLIFEYNLFSLSGDNNIFNFNEFNYVYVHFNVIILMLFKGISRQPKTWVQ